MTDPESEIVPGAATAAIHCAHGEVWPLDKLVEHPRNPNKHPPEQLRLLGKIILATGWRAPIVVSERSGYVIKGHGRLQAARLAGLTEAPVDVQEYPDEAAELADLVADNQLASLAEMDLSGLKDLLQELDTGALDMELTGFGEDALAGLFSQIHAPTEFPTADENISTEHKCPKCGYAWSGKQA